MDHHNMDHGGMGHGGMDHGDMDHGGGGDMDMCSMSVGLPPPLLRSPFRTLETDHPPRRCS